MTSASVSGSTEAALVEQIMSLLNRIDGKTAELQRTINGKLGWLSGGLQDRVVDGWNRFCGFLRQVWVSLTEVVTNMGSPSTLWRLADAWNNLADAWNNSVGAWNNSVGAQVRAAEAGFLVVDGNWEGEAADAYRQALPMQKAALEEIKTKYTDGISATLSDMATGIIAFWGSLIAALLTLVVGIIGAIASSSTIVGVPAGPFIAAGAAAVAVGAIFTGALVLESVAAGANSTLLRKLNDNTGYHDGHWPPAAQA